MASTIEAARLTEAHRLAQSQAGARLAAQALVAWRLLDVEDIDGTFDGWLSVMVPLVRSARRSSARLAANYLETFRTLELGVGVGRFTPSIVEELPFRQITTSLIVTGPAQLRTALERGVPLERAVDVASSAAAGAAMRHALNGGRETIQQTTESDGRALGYFRVVSGQPCWFCAMLASRGAVYKDDSFDRSDARFIGEGEVKVHDHCSCSFEPLYRRDAAAPAGADRWDELWQSTTRGLSGDDARKAFRRAVEAQR